MREAEVPDDSWSVLSPHPEDLFMRTFGARLRRRTGYDAELLRALCQSLFDLQESAQPDGVSARSLLIDAGLTSSERAHELAAALCRHAAGAA